MHAGVRHARTASFARPANSIIGSPLPTREDDASPEVSKRSEANAVKARLTVLICSNETRPAFQTNRSRRIEAEHGKI
jgi:hypothetical protein